MIAAVDSNPRDAWERSTHARPPVKGSLRWLACTAATVADSVCHRPLSYGDEGSVYILGDGPKIETRALSTAWDDFLVMVAVGWRAVLRPRWRRNLERELRRELLGTTAPGSVVVVRVVRALPAGASNL